MATSLGLYDAIQEASLDLLKTQLEAGGGTAYFELFNTNDSYPYTTRVSISLGAVSFTKTTFGPLSQPILVLDGTPFSGSSVATQTPTKWRIKNRSGVLTLSGDLGFPGQTTGFEVFANDAFSDSGRTYTLNSFSVTFANVPYARGSMSISY